MVNRLPSWLKQELPGKEAHRFKDLFYKFSVNTVCVQAHCPNINYCFDNQEVTFLILGKACTRNCRFCAVEKNKGESLPLDLDEPRRVAEAVKAIGLEYVVITSVTRDDLSDSGAGIFLETIRLIKRIGADIKVEALIPDFKGELADIKKVLDAKPDVVAHNLETVKGLYQQLRPMAEYGRSLGVLDKIKQTSKQVVTKSSLMLGLGESKEEVIEAMKDLKAIDCDVLTLGQYLAPSNKHYPVKEFISPTRFEEYKNIALGLGFGAVSCAPLVRSSFKAKEVYGELTYA